MSLIKKGLLGLALIFVLMQFFRIDKTNPTVIQGQDIASVVDMPPEIKNMLKTSCYDCHSNEAVYPWYSNIAPISWLVKDHINEGREELNFSEWGTYSAKRQDHKLEEIGEEVEEGEMPITGYVLIHSDARLGDAQKQQLEQWTKSARTTLGYKGGDEKNEREEHDEDHD